MTGASTTIGSDGLVALLREPHGAPEGALILNHGRGSDEHDLFGLLDLLDPDRRLLGVTTGAPLTDIPPGGRHWYLVPRVGHPDPRTFAASYAQLCGSLDELLADRGIGWERTVIGGFSMGAVMSYAVALGKDRPSPAGLLAFSGFIPAVEGWAPALGDRESVSVLIHHGRLDPVIPIEFGRGASEQLSAAGIAVEYLESDAGHSLPPAVVPPARELVFSATKAAMPR